jgi:hypothetical protein
MEVLLNTVYGIQSFDAETMSMEKFDRIKGDKYTPSFVYIDDKVAFYNDYTCLSSYKFGGGCNCINHPPKRWRKFNPKTGEWY